MDSDQLTDVARRIWHADNDEQRGQILVDVPDSDLEELSGILQEFEGNREAHFAEADRMITDHGYLIQGVFPTAEDQGPWFAYTVGLYPDYGAEFLVRGFGEQTPRVAELVAGWVRAGEFPLAPGVHVRPDGIRVRVDPWTGDPADFGMANARHGPGSRRCMSCWRMTRTGCPANPDANLKHFR